MAIGAAPAAAEERADAGARSAFEARLAEAATALDAGEFERAAARVRPLVREVGPARAPDAEDGAERPGPGGGAAAIPRTDRAEAWRIFGLALFFLGDFDRAERALLEYMKLEEGAHLDPALVPPEALVFFEDVRSRHSAEIRAYHPRPEERRWRLLNLAPPAGQFQNDDRHKGWIIAGAGLGLAGLNLGSYAVLRSWCGGSDAVCGEEGARYGQARALRAVNMASIVALGGLYAYGVVDGLVHFGSAGGASLSLAPAGAPGVAAWGRF